jgi:hypothetical protein
LSGWRSIDFHQNHPWRRPWSMDQKSFCLNRNREGLTARIIHDDLGGTFGEEAIEYNTVRKYLREVQITSGHAPSVSEAPSPHIDESDEAILRSPEELPFSSIRRFSCATHIPKTMVYRRLSEKLGYFSRHLQSVPHVLSDHQKATRTQCFQVASDVLRARSSPQEDETDSAQHRSESVRLGSTAFLDQCFQVHERFYRHSPQSIIIHWPRAFSDFSLGSVDIWSGARVNQSRCGCQQFSVIKSNTLFEIAEEWPISLALSYKWQPIPTVVYSTKGWSNKSVQVLLQRFRLLNKCQPLLSRECNDWYVVIFLKTRTVDISICFWPLTAVFVIIIHPLCSAYEKAAIQSRCFSKLTPWNHRKSSTKPSWTQTEC